jgi:hypothetical protein
VVEYLTTFEAAELLRVKSKTQQNLKARGVFREGCISFGARVWDHDGKRDALIEWLEGNRERGKVPISRTGRKKFGAVSGRQSRHQPAWLSPLPDPPMAASNTAGAVPFVWSSSRE